MSLRLQTRIPKILALLLEDLGCLCRKRRNTSLNRPLR